LRLREAHLLGVTHHCLYPRKQKRWVTPSGLRFAQPPG